MRGLFITTALMTALVGSAGAADLPLPAESAYQPPAVVAPVPTWTGLYVGAHVGWGSGEVDLFRDGPGGGNDPEDCPDGGQDFNCTFDVEGVFGGGQIGFDLQMSRFVFGVVADASVSAIDGNVSYDGPPTIWEVNYEWLASARGRLGFLLTDRALLYGHGGAFWADINLDEVGGAGPDNNKFFEDVEQGWIAGIGGEVMATENVSIFAEYSHYFDIDRTWDPPGGGGPGAPIEQDFSLDTIRVGANVKLHSLFGL